MVEITREKAICMFFGCEYNEERANELSKKIEEDKLNVCYYKCPLEPILTAIITISAEPDFYKQYKSKK